VLIKTHHIMVMVELEVAFLEEMVLVLILMVPIQVEEVPKLLMELRIILHHLTQHHMVH
jgi:hypothetical protein